jgi:hypothetical protein
MDHKYTWTEFDPEDESTHPKGGAKIEVQSANGSTVERYQGGTFAGAVDWGNLTALANAEQDAKFRWRYIERP